MGKNQHGLKQQCLDVMNQNEWLNPLFDKAAKTYIEARDEFLSRDNSLCYSPEAMERAKYQHCYHKFLFSLLEDIHRYTYLSSFEIFLYEERLSQKEDSSFFSSRYFLTNASHHIIGTWERTLRLCGLLYGYDFDRSSKYEHIYRALKKNQEFNKSKVFELLKYIVERNHLSDIEKLRKGNDHELSVHTKHKEDDDLKEYATSCFLTVKSLYEVIHFFIDRFQKECFIRIKPIDLSQFRWGIPLNIKKIEESLKKELGKKLFYRLENSFISLSNLILDITALWPITAEYLTQKDEKSLYILHHTDPIFRLHEATNSLRYGYKLIVSANETGQDLRDVSVYFKDMDYSYFIESSIIRIYSVFDKLAVLLHHHTGLGEICTFEQFMRRYASQPINNSEWLTQALNIYETEVYKELNQLRQDNFHHIAKEGFIHLTDSENSHLYNMVIASKNIEMLIPMLSKMFCVLKDKLLSIEGL